MEFEFSDCGPTDEQVSCGEFYVPYAFCGLYIIFRQYRWKTQAL